ncbi:hypothetical protein [Thermotalea metallivorans]|uniref:PrcB C-terminal domain-containing protein n=1 Tax=Thermotalea metallivorans TaxID=520762 RepID=A0A140L7E6_9FIRM|nr:hypothetical protein [Thermotalea metallivorans]KXG76471.1 hypothetical protein AN619_10020 [Thermotalea metallivorans]
MKKFFLFFVLGSIGMFGLIGCNNQEITGNVKDFKMIYDTGQLDQEVIHWIYQTKSNTGIYKKHFSSGTFILISLTDHPNYLIKKVHIKKDKHGYIFSITLKKSGQVSSLLNEPLPSSPIILQSATANDNATYDMKVIYQ